MDDETGAANRKCGYKMSIKSATSAFSFHMSPLPLTTLMSTENETVNLENTSFILNEPYIFTLNPEKPHLDILIPFFY